MSVRFQSGRTTVPHSGLEVRRAGPGSGRAEQKGEGARQGDGRLWPGGLGEARGAEGHPVQG